jgi:hypothetical protein
MCESSDFPVNFIYKASTPEYGGALPFGCACQTDTLKMFFKN